MASTPSSQFIGNNLAYILPNPNLTHIQNDIWSNKPTISIAPFSAPPKVCFGTPAVKSSKRKRQDDNDKNKGGVDCKRKLDFAKLSLPAQCKSPVISERRNERERKRVKNINQTLDVLKDHLPIEFQTPKSKSKELSKVEILRGAIEYINSLEDILQQANTDSVSDFTSEFSAIVQASEPTPAKCGKKNISKSKLEKNVYLEIQNVCPNTPSRTVSDFVFNALTPKSVKVETNIETPSACRRKTETKQLPTSAFSNTSSNINSQVQPVSYLDVASSSTFCRSSSYRPRALIDSSAFQTQDTSTEISHHHSESVNCTNSQTMYNGNKSSIHSSNKVISQQTEYNNNLKGDLNADETWNRNNNNFSSVNNNNVAHQNLQGATNRYCDVSKQPQNQTYGWNESEMYNSLTCNTLFNLPDGSNIYNTNILHNHTGDIQSAKPSLKPLFLQNGLLDSITDVKDDFVKDDSNNAGLFLDFTSLLM